MDIVDVALQKITPYLPKGSLAVGLSGGVDSAVSAFLLKQLGYDVFGIFMRNWEEKEGGSCPADKDAADVAAIASVLKIPFYTISFTKEYQDLVFALFLEELQKGLTPNPDILCNKEIKFAKLLEKALQIGSVGIGTGHYASSSIEEDRYLLRKALDKTKDQSYFLYTATQSSLKHSVFPLAFLQKTEVRKIAERLHLPVAQKKDSTGICFIGERKFKEFLKPFLGYSKGPIISTEGKILAEHIGLAYYTIGQRKGLCIGGEGEPWFVVRKDLPSNALIVAQGFSHPALFAKGLKAEGASWISGKAPSFPLQAQAKIRYRQEDQKCSVSQSEDGSLLVSFDLPQRAITPGQSIVFYQDSECLGGAFITCAYEASA